MDFLKYSGKSAKPDERNIRKSHIPAQDNCENILHNMPMKVVDYREVRDLLLSKLESDRR